jgi:hypothetical protein
MNLHLKNEGQNWKTGPVGGVLVGRCMERVKDGKYG